MVKVKVSQTDPVADMLTRLRNGGANNAEHVLVPASKLTKQLLKLLKSAGFISDYASAKDTEGALSVMLDGAARPIIGAKRLSKPGRRLYAGHQLLPSSRGGRGLILVSTSQGLMPTAVAKQRRLGGELICEVW